jgi:hypothetical protein
MAGTISSSKTVGKGRGLVKITASVLSDASGVATATVVGEAVGRLVAVGYDPQNGAGAAYATGGTITISDADTGAALVTYASIGTAAFWERPTAVITDNAGAAVTAAATAVDVNRDIYVAGKIKVAGTAGGNLGTCRIILVIDESGF